MSSRRVALISNSGAYVGPELARQFAARGHDLVLGDPADGLVDELTATGVEVEVVTGVSRAVDPESAPKLVSAALRRFGRIDAAVMFSGGGGPVSFQDATIEDLRRVQRGCVEAPFQFMQAVLGPMVEAGSGQILVLTSAVGSRVSLNAPLYSAARAGATHLVKNVAAEVAPFGVAVNALGTNYMDFPGFLFASGATDPESRASLEENVPMGRLGTMEECATLCMAYLDGTCTFVTGQFVSHDGGWSL